jgi:hypothetical protein
VWPHDVESFQGSKFCLFVMVQPWNIGVYWIDQVFVTELTVVIFLVHAAVYEFSLLRIFSMVIQLSMSAYIRKTDGVYIFSTQKRLKHGRQNITLHWINGIIQNNKCIFTKLNAVFILNTAAWTKNITTAWRKILY